MEQVEQQQVERVEQQQVELFSKQQDEQHVLNVSRTILLRSVADCASVTVAVCGWRHF